MDDIIESHRMATLWRCRAEREVLAIQDTTMLDFSGLKGSTGGLAKLGGGGSGSVGNPGARDAGGVGLGLLAIDAGFREGVTVKADRRREDTGRAETETPDGGSGSRRWLEGLALAQEVGRTSPGTRMVTVCDREGDIWDMFEAQAEDPAAAGLLVRSSAPPRRSVIAGGEVVDLMEHVSGLPAAGTRTVHVAARGGITGSRGRKAVRARPARTAETEIRVARVELKAPGRSRQTLPVTAVLASETTAPPKGGRRLSWLLLSSDAEPDLQDAIDTVRRYETGWTIEEYFRTLKQCTRIEDRRLDEADDLRRCPALRRPHHPRGRHRHRPLRRLHPLETPAPAGNGENVERHEIPAAGNGDVQGDEGMGGSSRVTRGIVTGAARRHALSGHHVAGPSDRPAHLGQRFRGRQRHVVHHALVFQSVPLPVAEPHHCAGRPGLHPGSTDAAALSRQDHPVERFETPFAGL